MYDRKKIRSAQNVTDVSFFVVRDDNIEQPWADPKMKKINNHAMGMLKNDLASWKREGETSY